MAIFQTFPNLPAGDRPHSLPLLTPIARTRKTAVGRYGALYIATPMHSAQLCAVHEPVGLPHEEGDPDIRPAALHSFRRSTSGAHSDVAENDGPADFGYGAGNLGKAV